MKKQPAMFGFISEKAIASGCPTYIYSQPDGSWVETSFVTNDPKGESYKWPDKRRVGKVVSFIQEKNRERKVFRNFLDLR